MANHTRPDLSFDVLKFSNCLKEAKVSDLLAINKTVKKLKDHPCHILFPKLDPQTLNLKLFTDAAFANLPDGFSSTGGRILLLCDGHGAFCPVAWSSTKIQRVVTSSLSAEAHSLIDGLDASYCVNALISETIFKEKGKQLAVVALVDSLSLVQNVQSTTLISEKHLRVNIASIQESIGKEEVSLEWIPRAKQLADILTKNGVDPSILLSAFGGRADRTVQRHDIQA